MKKSTKFILYGLGLFALGVASYFIIRPKQEDLGSLPDPDATGNVPSTGENEENNTEGSNPIAIGDLIYPYGTYVYVRSSMEVDNGGFGLEIDALSNKLRKYFSPNAIGEVVGINNQPDHVWYLVELNASPDIGTLVYGDDGLEATQGYVRADVVTK
jgi:hypothetical protein